MQLPWLTLKHPPANGGNTRDGVPTLGQKIPRRKWQPTQKMVSGNPMDRVFHRLPANRIKKSRITHLKDQNKQEVDFQISVTFSLMNDQCYMILVPDLICPVTCFTCFLEKTANSFQTRLSEESLPCLHRMSDFLMAMLTWDCYLHVYLSL